MILTFSLSNIQIGTEVQPRSTPQWSEAQHTQQVCVFVCLFINTVVKRV